MIRRCFLLVAATWLGSSSLAHAAGGPESVLLVVNSQSADSKCIANYYMALRHIPANNVLFLSWDPTLDSTDVATFRQKILEPVMRAALLPIPGRQIDYVVYSAGFPWGIRIEDDITKLKDFLNKMEPATDAKTPEETAKDNAAQKIRAELLGTLKFATPVGSINGMTYLWQMVLPGQFYLSPRSNWYSRTGAVEQKDQPTLAFSSAQAFGPRGELSAGPGRHYVLSMVLGVTSGRGNKVSEVINYLKRSTAADGTHPKGTIYYMKNGDVRSTTRDRDFPAAVEQLKALGVKAEIVNGTVPNKPDVQGVMAGVADFVWNAADSTIQPGAICEHFTSFGGDMRAKAEQTPLSVFLRYGAAAASGTVTEPFAIAQKFPSASLQVHYARGCTTAEAFYQSVQCPYQLLIVGDPLCRPWANIPEVTVSGATPGASVRGTLHLEPKARFADKTEADHFELYLDGMQIRRCAVGGVLDCDTQRMADGAHELRVAVVSKGLVPAHGEAFVAINSQNHGHSIEVRADPPKYVSLHKPLVITAKAPGCTAIRVMHATATLGEIQGEDGKIDIDPQVIGRGPVRLQVVGVGSGGLKSNVFAQPLDLVIEE